MPMRSEASQIPEGHQQIGTGRLDLGEAGRIALSNDPVCREAIAFTLRYASFALGRRERLPIIEGQEGLSHGE